MIVAVINRSGNVGKSTISRHLLAPRIKDSIIIPVETINSDDSQDEAYKGTQFGELSEALNLIDAAVVDIGSSNNESFTDLMKEYDGSHEDFDYFVIPTLPDPKIQKDTISTIRDLSSMGVPAKKIRVLFNEVPRGEDPEKIFSGLFKYQEDNSKQFTIKKDAVIHKNELFGKINGTGQSILEILNDPTDYKEKAKLSSDMNEKMHYSRLLAIKRLASGVTNELDSVFKTLFK